MSTLTRGCTHAQCGMLLTGPVPTGLLQCSACAQVAYCSKACQKLMWTKKHKKECAALRAAGVGRRVSQQAALRQALQSQSQFTPHQSKVLNDLKTRHDAEDHQGVVDLTVEVCGVAAALRTTHFITSACMYMYIGQGHLHSHLYQDAIGYFSTALPMFEEIRSGEIAANRMVRGDRLNLCAVCTDLATCYCHKNRFEQALVLYERALVVAKETGDRQALGTAKRNLGGMHQVLKHVFGMLCDVHYMLIRY